MKIVQNVIVALIVAGCLALTCSLAGAQDVGQTMVVGTVTLDVTLRSSTDVCTRVTSDTLSCTRFEDGRATKIMICEVTKTGLKCASAK